MIYFELFFIFVKVGLFTIGGGYAMLPMIQSEVVARGLLSTTQMWDIVAVAQMTPGAFAINVATFTGMQSGGILGAVMATVGVLTPSIVITTSVAVLFNKIRGKAITRKIFYGIRPVVLGLIAGTTIALIKEQWFGSQILNVGAVNIISIIIAVISGALLIKTKVNPVFVILGSGLVGLIVYSVGDMILFL